MTGAGSVKSPTSLGAVVARNVRLVRERRGWTFVELAALLTAAGWPVEVLSVRRIEAGTRRVSVDELAVLGAVFGVEPWSLTQAPSCGVCLGSPPPGFGCLECGAGQARANGRGSS